MFNFTPVCPKNHYGETCLHECACDTATETCDPIRGCVCDTNIPSKYWNQIMYLKITWTKRTKYFLCNVCKKHEQKKKPFDN